MPSKACSHRKPRGSPERPFAERPRACAREAKTDQGHAIEILGFQTRKTGDIRADQESGNHFSAAAAISRKVRGASACMFMVGSRQGQGRAAVNSDGGRSVRAWGSIPTDMRNS